MFTPKKEELLELGFVQNGDILTCTIKNIKYNYTVELNYDSQIEGDCKFYTSTEDEETLIKEIESLKDIINFCEALALHGG